LLAPVQGIRSAEKIFSTCDFFQADCMTVSARSSALSVQLRATEPTANAGARARLAGTKCPKARQFLPSVSRFARAVAADRPVRPRIAFRAPPAHGGFARPLSFTLGH
jgi:hypothetical protein